MQALARHLEQAEGGDAADLDARAVVLQRFLEAALDLRVVAVLLHVDEVDDDEARQVAQPQLARDFLRRLDIGAQRGLFDVALAGGAAGVDVDRDQRLGLVEHDVAAGAQMHHRLVDRRDLALDLVALEQRLRLVAIGLHPAWYGWASGCA